MLLARTISTRLLKESLAPIASASAAVARNHQMASPPSAATASRTTLTRSKVDMETIRKLKHLEEISPDVYRANFVGPGSIHTHNVYGGLIFSQAMEAAARSVSSQEKHFSPNSVQGSFILNGSTETPIDYRVQRLRDGRSFCTRIVQAVQDDKTIFAALVSLCVKEPTSIEHLAPMPTVPDPESLSSYFDVARSHLKQHEQGLLRLPEWSVAHIHHRFAEESNCVFEFRPTNPVRQMGLGSRQWLPYDAFTYWIRPVCHISAAGNDSVNKRSLHQFLLAFVTDGTMPSTANQPHYSNGYRPSMILSLDHVVHFHDDSFDINDWLLYENWSDVAKNGRAYSQGRIWTRDGKLILSVQQESLSRTRQDSSKI